MGLWLIKQGFSNDDIREMSLAKAAFYMKAAFSDSDTKDGERKATKGDFRMLL